MTYANNTNQDVSDFHAAIVAAMNNGGMFDDDLSDIFELTKTPEGSAVDTFSILHKSHQHDHRHPSQRLPFKPTYQGTQPWFFLLDAECRRSAWVVFRT